MDKTLYRTGRYACQSIAEMMEELVEARAQANASRIEAAQEAIQHDPRELCWRQGWQSTYHQDKKPVEYRIVLAMGLPATRIQGELDENLNPTSAALQVKDWGTPWVDYRVENKHTTESTPLLDYAREFNWGGLE